MGNKEGGRGKNIPGKAVRQKYEQPSRAAAGAPVLREKDVLVIESLDRLGRNYAEIVQIVQKLDRKKIGLQILNMPILNQDMGDPNLQQLIRNMIIQILSWTAQNEREEIKRKQKQGIVIAKEKGHYKGRPVKYASDAKNPKDRMTYHVIVNKLKLEEPIKKIAEDTGVTRDTVYRIKKQLFNHILPSK